MLNNAPLESAMDTAPAPQRTESPPTVRLLTVVIFLAIWMAAGGALHLNADAYLLLGVPLTIIFQLFVRRQPLRALWLRDAPPLRCDAWWLLLTLAFALLPVIELLHTDLRHDWIGACWLLCALFGGAGAAYSLRHWDRKATSAIPIAFAVVAVVCFLFISSVYAHRSHISNVAIRGAVLLCLRYILLYFPVNFLIEEVTFRGALDAHIHRPGDKKGIASALLLSILWGWWHLPVVPHAGGLMITLTRLALVHVSVGCCFSLAWRNSGNLAVSGSAHAVLDAVRNGVQSLM